MSLFSFTTSAASDFDEVNQNIGFFLQTLAINALNSRNQDLTAGKTITSEHQIIYDVLNAGTNIDTATSSNTRGYDASTDKFWFVTTGDECDDSSIDANLWITALTGENGGNGQISEGSGGIALTTRLNVPPVDPPDSSGVEAYFTQNFKGSNDWMTAFEFDATVNPRSGTNGTFKLNIRNTAGTQVDIISEYRENSDVAYTIDDTYYFYFEQGGTQVRVYSVGSAGEIAGSPFDLSGVTGEWFISYHMADNLTAGAGSYAGHDTSGVITSVRSVEADQTVTFRTSNQTLSAIGGVIGGKTDITIGNGVNGGTVNTRVSSNGGYSFTANTAELSALHLLFAPSTNFQLEHTYTVVGSFVVGTDYVDTSVNGWAYYYDTG